MNDDDFVDAAARAKDLSSVSNENKLRIYGCYKSATIGLIKGSRPGRFDPVGRAKFDAWERASKAHPTKEEGKKAYVKLIDELGSCKAGSPSLVVVSKEKEKEEGATTPTPSSSSSSASLSSTSSSSSSSSSSRVAQLEKEIKDLKAELSKQQASIKHPQCTSFRRNFAPPSSAVTAGVDALSAPPQAVKSGYLNKWRDRAIGWSGSKWGPRYVTLTDDGRLLYAGKVRGGERRARSKERKR